LGLGAAVPYMLHSDANTASYKTQATFSISSWPFSLKLAWAPLVDSLYFSRIGRRKTWLIPVQYAIGIDLLVLASHVDHWFGRDPNNPWGPMGVTNPVDIAQLTASFFGLTMLAATQDIAVDGWALTMLSKRNLGWASTCNTVGQTVGYVVAFILLLSLESPDIANTYLRKVPVEGKGIITFSSKLKFPPFHWPVLRIIGSFILDVFTIYALDLLKRINICSGTAFVLLYQFQFVQPLTMHFCAPVFVAVFWLPIWMKDSRKTAKLKVESNGKWIISLV
uniref:Acetyl-coenzyme A transporter 1 n=1 Tax=Echinostoma caproni TaxID=27848 RepID=A0A183B9V3_9TREM